MCDFRVVCVGGRTICRERKKPAEERECAFRPRLWE